MNKDFVNKNFVSINFTRILFSVFSVIMFHLFLMRMHPNMVYSQHVKSINKVEFAGLLDQIVDMQYTDAQLLRINELLKHQYTPKKILYRGSRGSSERCSQEKFHIERTIYGGFYKKYEDDDEYLKCKEHYNKELNKKKSNTIIAHYSYFSLNQIDLSREQQYIL